MSRAIAFVVSHPYVDALACFREPIKAFADAGWDVDVYTGIEPSHSIPNFHRDGVRLIRCVMSRGGLARLILQLVSHRPRYRAILTCPQWSLHYSGIAARMLRIPLGVISDELTSDEEAVTEVQRTWKERERQDHQRATFTIALSDERAGFIRDSNQLSPAHPTFVVPNAPPGPARRLRSRYYQDVLGLADDAFLVLHAGSMGWRLAAELASGAVHWEAGAELVFQGRLREEMEGRKSGSGIHFSTTVLPAEMLDYVASSAHVGLALYESTKVNDRLMGTASGKIMLYLKNELPVITTRQACFRWIEDEGLGICVDRIADVRGAVDAIRRDYDRFVGNIQGFYAMHLDFTRRFAPVMSFINQTTAITHGVAVGGDTRAVSSVPAAPPIGRPVASSRSRS